ncbi:hypothetical protein NC653_019775 [Populus alba x Populus x berolinensis]|uniref:Uncharacterized protein n=1 Tax=Populus alba x Populus x berolinensis TaxID=444605 RepID=A0AAD6VXS4_9ROSI|nr:hypothetical protein NC653_019488 [Populus alba x Populus x berolinensis]KAJ6991710.1 hypothetical protein NC653_019775 [Populus alba x Populus x berolinensis]
MLSSDSVGCRVYSLSCYISDDIHSLFSLLSLPPPPPPPPHLIKTNSTSTETKDSTSNDGLLCVQEKGFAVCGRKSDVEQVAEAYMLKRDHPKFKGN